MLYYQQLDCCDSKVKDNMVCGRKLVCTVPYIGSSLHVRFEHHVHTKFAIPILQATYTFENYDIFSTYT